MTPDELKEAVKNLLKEYLRVRVTDDPSYDSCGPTVRVQILWENENIDYDGMIIS